MRARYLKNAEGWWKGIHLTPYCVFDVPEELQHMVSINANFQVLPKRGRPRKVYDADAD